MGIKHGVLNIALYGKKYGVPLNRSSSVYISIEQMSHVMRKPTFWFPTWSDTNQALQPQKIARGLKFRI